MTISSLVVDKAEQLAAAGHHAELIEYLAAREASELQESPELALLYGTAHARLGRHEDGLRWVNRALEAARRRQGCDVGRGALNARGAIALISGQIDRAADYFTQGLIAASRDSDLATTGRCSNNLGIIGNLRGRHAEAIGSWEIAVAAFERAGLHQGVAECRHNLALSYREQGMLDRALREANRAVAEAEVAGDLTLRALAQRGRAETRLASGDVGGARRELDEVRDFRTRAPNPIDAGEDLRVVAAILAADGHLPAAERTLREVLEQGLEHQCPQLAAETMRDLAAVLRRAGRGEEAQAAALTAKAIFSRLGAEGEIRKLAGQEWDEPFAAELGEALAPLHEAQELADAGRYADLLRYLDGRSQNELERSPMLALLCGIGHSRLGRLDEGRRWAMAALSRAQVLGDRVLEVRGLNVCGAIALERGGIEEATRFFAQAQEAAMQINDLTTVGRCANNLGIVANLRGEFGAAAGAYKRALAAYQQARHERGIVESQHNLAITYREQGRLDEAMQAADAAVLEAERLGDERLRAQALAGRAEIRIARGEPELAVREVEGALAIHHEMGDAVRETEDLRILAVARGAAGEPREAIALLRDVIARARAHERPELVAAAQRDLALLLAGEGDTAGAGNAARAARAAFARMGARAEVLRLDALGARLRPPSRSQRLRRV